MHSFAGGGTWDVDKHSDFKFRAYPVEFANLREKLTIFQPKSISNVARFNRFFRQSTVPRLRTKKDARIR